MPQPIKSLISLPESIARQLPDRTFQPLETAISTLEEWTRNLPKHSCFYINEDVIYHRQSQIPPKLKHIDVITADVLLDIHSIYAAQCLSKSWRADQLAEGLVGALSTWNITVAAGIARALVETAACWLVESHELSVEWERAKQMTVESVDAAMQVRHLLQEASIQLAWASRLPAIAKKSKQFRRKGVLTLIEKAEKKESFPGLREKYEILCDAVHPSWGSSECFWGESGQGAEIRQFRVLLARDSVGWLGSMQDAVRAGSQLPLVIVSCAAWAVQALACSLPAFDRVCRDLCLTAKIFLLSNLDYWGIVNPTGTYDPCACGSGKKSKFCNHRFGGN